MILIKSKKVQPGFALLMTIIVVSVIITVTLAIVDLSLKQLKLANDSTDSEIAFHAANAGMECARYLRNKQSDKFEAGKSVAFNCFNDSGSNMVTTKSGNPLPFENNTPADSRLYQYKQSLEWGDVDHERCSALNIVVMMATSTFSIGSNSNHLDQYFSGYETNTKTCQAGSVCTLISVIGYSSSCNDVESASTLRREILLEF